MGTISEIVEFRDGESVTKTWKLKNWSKHHRLITTTRTFTLALRDVTFHFSLKPFNESFVWYETKSSMEFYSLCTAVETARDELAFRVSGTITPVYNQAPSYPVTEYNFETQAFYSATKDATLEPLVLEEKLIFMRETNMAMSYVYKTSNIPVHNRFCGVDELHLQLTARIVHHASANNGHGQGMMLTKTPTKLEVDDEFQDFGRALYVADGPNFYDVQLKMADGVYLPAHRVILAARSPVFRAMFTSAMKESGEGKTVEIADLGSPAMKVILEFIYTGKVNDAWKENVGEVVRAASKYLLKKLLAFCDTNLIQVCDSKNAMELYRIANLYSLNTAMKQVTAYIHTNTTNVLKSMTLKQA